MSHASLLCGASWTENSVVTSLDPPLYACETMFLRGWFQPVTGPPPLGHRAPPTGGLGLRSPHESCRDSLEICCDQSFCCPALLPLPSPFPSVRPASLPSPASSPQPCAAFPAVGGLRIETCLGSAFQGILTRKPEHLGFGCHLRVAWPCVRLGSCFCGLEQESATEPSGQIRPAAYAL